MRSHLRLASVVGAFALGTVAMAPALAAAPVSQSGANAITASVAGNAQGSGDSTATNDGSTETKSGQETPPVSVLGGQQLLSLGVLAQQATARADGTSAACAGLAGRGGSVVNIGDSDCLVPGSQVNASLGSLDLSGLIVANPNTALAPINQLTAPLIAQVAPVIAQVLTPLQEQFDDLGLALRLGAVEGRCTASTGSAEGSATLADAGITLTLPGQPALTLVNLPVNPEKNTHVATDLSGVLTTVLDALRTNLTTALGGQLAQLDPIIGQVQTQIVDNVVTQVEGQLAPLEENILDITLNRQVEGDDGSSIKVRALDLSLLPVVQEQLGSALVSLQIGNAACGPNGPLTSAAVAAPEAATAPAAIPTAVSAGYATMPGEHAGAGDDSTNAIVLGAFALLVAGAAGFVTLRRLRA